MKYNSTVLFVSILASILNACNYHYYLQKPSSGFASIPDLLKLRIVYMGFRSYQAETTVSNGEGRVYTANLVYPERTIPKFQNGFYASDLKAFGFRKDVSSEKVKKFAQDFLNDVKESGVLELTYVTAVEKKGSERIFKLKDLGADYYVVGVHSPAFQKNSGAISGFVQLFSSVFSVLTFGLIPSYASLEAETTIRIYDKNLNLLTTQTYDNAYSVLGALWASSYPEECGRMGCDFKKQIVSPPAFVYKDFGPEFESGIVQFILSSGSTRK
ncbi:hypothetical protein EHQ12_16435 [Leptospira gomenensis]|uniref:Lipoprotein n=1 Tax=Leptospira gomenensis TaxID=2484974 RepID=A0A5F1Y8U5_9LEPT|nr:hypothetical protein [Leptospira gomenensis]TGK31787.1 hypothetical protein EHQ17_13490 [Leptospira gomenensis]TGK34802.1 hypothetical protein EHQ12_16435 [Leptospira gomenensis]TGK41585.1 hypothetical protein EHQ07_15985 [Leptospira gomenensis]TGK61455.1 hypothetical protein EHQ13_08880 [Leptospira gomenensis]